MKHNEYMSKSLKISDLKFIWDKTLNVSVLRRSLIPHFILIIVSFLYFACSKETSISSYPEMQAYYAESCNCKHVLAQHFWPLSCIFPWPWP